MRFYILRYSSRRRSIKRVNQETELAMFMGTTRLSNSISAHLWLHRRWLGTAAQLARTIRLADETTSEDLRLRRRCLVRASRPSIGEAWTGSSMVSPLGREERREGTLRSHAICAHADRRPTRSPRGRGGRSFRFSISVAKPLSGKCALPGNFREGWDSWGAVSCAALSRSTMRGGRGPRTPKSFTAWLSSS
jgi:hypothetical protein